MNASQQAASGAKKSLGQHFLKTPSVAQHIVALLQPSPRDRILEIGPGPGALTDLLRKIPPAELLLIEKDDKWARYHAQIDSPYPTRRVLHQDALTFSWKDLLSEWKIISNLPYNIASPLIWDIVSNVSGLSRAVFMVQKEVAERLIAQPDRHDYGALSVWVQSFVRVEWGFAVGPGHFAPPPKVDSAVVVVSPLSEKASFDPDRLSLLLKICFQQRRKQLQSLLKRQGLPALAAGLQELGIDPSARPENLTPSHFHTLCMSSEFRLEPKHSKRPQ